MAATTHPKFGAHTEALEVAKAFPGSIRGKTILVTGTNLDGLGFSTCEAFASQLPSHLILAGRSNEKLQTCFDKLVADYPEVSCRLLKLDLSSQEEIRAAAAELLSWSDVSGVDILVNNAAVMGIQERTLTKDGIEMHFGTNHIGHWLFACLIMPKLMKAASVSPKGATRIVNVSSASPRVSKLRCSDVNFDKKNKDLPEAEQPDYDWMRMWSYNDPEEMAYIPLDGYDRSKVANVLFGIGATCRLYETYGILSVSVHPGVIGTELGRHFPTETIKAIGEMIKEGDWERKTRGAGASTTLVAALDPKLKVESKPGCENYGAYLEDCQISEKANFLSMSSKEAEKLWKLSEDLVGQEFAW